MKCEIFHESNGKVVSRPARGAWIEILTVSGGKSPRAGRAPQGARGLKYDWSRMTQGKAGVAPRKGRVD